MIGIAFAVVLVIYGMAMLFILLYGLSQMHLLYVFLRRSPSAVSSVSLSEPAIQKVTIQLPIYNERYVVERLLHAVARIDYPRDKIEIQILDDSTDETSEIIKNTILLYPEVPFIHLQRSDRKGFKAGALKYGLEKAKGDLIAIFDSDFIPDADFIHKTSFHFEDPEVGMVQTRWAHINKEYSLMTRLQAFALDAHFVIEQTGRNIQGAFINFNGTGGIWRKSCILDSGNWQDDTLTEDLDLSYRAQQKGWKFIYRPDVESPAELPPVMSAIKSQQFRWTKGGAECARKHLADVFKKPFATKVKLHATAHLLNAMIFPAVLMVSFCSVLMWFGLFTGHLEVGFSKYFAFLLIGFIGIASVYFTGNAWIGGFKWKAILKTLRDLPLFFAISMGLAVHNSIAVWEGFTGIRSPFVRTPKYNVETKDNSLFKNVYHLKKLPFSTYVELFLAVLFLVLLIASLFFSIHDFILLHFFLMAGYSFVSLASFTSSLRSF
jgi:cellulose synthase/poly-beta-1,6-N-acetylglucosamine synthase-like glycosyltransferase